jgi:hypothetical protein
MERTTAEFIALADENAQQHRIFRYFHFQVPRKRLMRVASA